MLNLPLYPFFFFPMKMVQVTIKRRYVLTNTPVHPQVPPPRSAGLRGGSSAALSLKQSEQTFQPEDAGWLSWER